MTPKYMKDKSSELVLEFIKDVGNGYFIGKVVVSDQDYPLGFTSDRWYKPWFEPCEDPKVETNPTENTEVNSQPQPSNDIEVRLKCLELAIEFNKPYTHSIEYITADAEYLLAWATKTTKA